MLLGSTSKYERRGSEQMNRFCMAAFSHKRKERLRQVVGKREMNDGSGKEMKE